MSAAKSNKWHGLPPPDSFKNFVKDIPHYKNEYWHSIFDQAIFIELAKDLQKGSSIVTDMDYTVYYEDAGFGLLEACHQLKMFSKKTSKRYKKLFKNYEDLPSIRSLEQKKIDEKNFYKETLKCFSGLKIETLKKLSEKLWFEGFSKFHKKPLLHFIYPEMAYLFGICHQSIKSSQHGIVAVSSSPDFSLEPLLNILPIPRNHLCAVQFKEKNKALTSEISLFIHGEDKVQQSEKILPHWDYAFGDNPSNDLPFLLCAKKGSFGIGKAMKNFNKTFKNHSKKMKAFYFLPFQKPPMAC